MGGAEVLLDNDYKAWNPDTGLLGQGFDRRAATRKLWKALIVVQLLDFFIRSVTKCIF
jgi:hypothetical protein